MRYSVDAHLDLRAEDLFGKIDSDYFQNPPKGDPTLDSSMAPIGTRAPGQRQSGASTSCVDYVLSTQTDLYLRRADGSVVHRGSGDQRPFQSCAGELPRTQFPHPPGWRGIGGLISCAVAGSSMQVPMTMYTEPAFLNQVRDAQFGIGIYYGMILALLLYNLILFASLRDANYLYYSTYAARLWICAVLPEWAGCLWPNLAAAGQPAAIWLDGARHARQCISSCVFLDLSSSAADRQSAFSGASSFSMR